MVNGVNIIHDSGLSAGIDVRHIGDRAANEDYSIVAEGYTVVDMNMNYDFKNYGIGF